MAYTKTLHAQNLKLSLDQAANSDLDLKVEIIANGCCDECDKINETIFSLEDVLMNPPLPHPKCTREPFCYCCYGFIPVEDE